MLLLACVLAASRAAADPFPEQPVKIVIPYPISGPTDIRGTTRVTKTYKLIALHAPPSISDTLARLAAQAIGAASRHPVVLERQPGGLTTRGAKAVARAAGGRLHAAPREQRDHGHQPALSPTTSSTSPSAISCWSRRSPRCLSCCSWAPACRRPRRGGSGSG